MLVLFGMTLALVAASAASFGAGLYRRPKNLDIGAGASGGHCSGCRTDIGAVEVQPDALPELGHHFFRQAGVSAGCAGLRTVIRLLYELQELVGRVALNMRVGTHHLANVHLSSSCISL
ncbi:hypothetical protein [Jannaschia rubra]|jgi:hypothetical protein|uniref:hypothetical protein n=2 Tax=Rhodobacterales TaxID=204455 RepID=UPI0024937C40|nr:hypothetical protein [Jannaschia rubra]